MHLIEVLQPLWSCETLLGLAAHKNHMLGLDKCLPEPGSPLNEDHHNIVTVLLLKKLPEVIAIVISILQMGKLRHAGVIICLAQKIKQANMTQEGKSSEWSPRKRWPLVRCGGI